MPSDAEVVPLISKGLYSIVSDIIGPECIVKLRREKYDIFTIILNACYPTFSAISTAIMSGSTGEGFQMKTSDYDYMFVFNDVTVIPNDLPVHGVCHTQTCVLTYETDYTSPGFVIIRCIYLDERNANSSTSHRSISDSLLWNSIGPCVSSKLFREHFLAYNPSAEIHGPCVSCTNPIYEYDFAFCLRCSYWPREASSFINRSLLKGWPSRPVLNEILNDGCLFVPISGKQLHCQDAFDLESRMSFSLAEKKLVSSMNHCQFLCYGLLKIFLNEVLKQNDNVNDLLCSYFLKTAVFWEICEDTTGWIVENFLCKFLNTFCRLIKWVHVGYCPNFFNPKNNMFAGKIEGHRQRLLMEALRSYHSEGLQCLLRCPSLNASLTLIVRQPYLSMNIPVSEELTISPFRVEQERILCILSSVGMIKFSNISKLLTQLYNIRQIRPNSRTVYQTVKHSERHLLQIIGETILMRISESNCYINNKTVKKYLHIALNILCRNTTTFCANDTIVAKWFYILGMYNITINVLNNVKRRLQSSQFMYFWTMKERDYIRLRRPDTSYESFLKSSIVDHVTIYEENAVSELRLEIMATKEATDVRCILISPIVFVNFLLLLSYHHFSDTIHRNDVLRDLHALVWYDYHIDPCLRAISWEILAICQQICGDYHGAYQSYINALNDKYNLFTQATIIRIRSLDYV